MMTLSPQIPSRIWRTMGVLLLSGGLFFMQYASAASEIIVWKSPSCGCCEAWIRHMQEHGFTLKVIDENNMHTVKTELGVPRELQSCHSATVDGYVIEGHVPAADVQRLLEEKPAVVGLAVPGMPMGSPGMEGPTKVPYQVIAFTQNGETQVFASYKQ